MRKTDHCTMKGNRGCVMVGMLTFDKNGLVSEIICLDCIKRDDLNGFNQESIISTRNLFCDAEIYFCSRCHKLLGSENDLWIAIQRRGE